MNSFKKSYKHALLLYILILSMFLIACTDKTLSTQTTNTSNNGSDISKPSILANDEEKDTLIIEESTSTANTFTDDITYDIKKSPYKELFTRNNDYIGWISINDTNIDLPIVKGEDNDEYLRRNFDYEKDQKGSIFMDYRNFGFGFSKNTILYGHNLKTNEMFGDLKNYSDSSYGLSHNIIEITDLYGTRKYQVFSSYFEDADSDLITTDFSSNSFNDYLSTISNLSIVDYSLTPSSQDNILTLVTCSYELDDGRFYLHAIEVDH